MFLKSNYCIYLTIVFITLIYFQSFPQDGLVKLYYDNGKLKSEIDYSDNVREGLAIFYYENGNIEKVLNYSNGKVEGLIKVYDKDGDINEMFNIKNGKRDGPSSLFDSSGTYLSDINFDNGKLVTEDDLNEKDYKEESSPTASGLKENKFKELPHLVEENFETDPAYYLTPDVWPEPIGGMENLAKKLFYPSLAKTKKIEGTVKILAFINKDGKVTQAEVKEGIGYGCDEAARNLIYYSGFNPGLIRGKPVNVQMVIPIKFKLDK